MSDASSEEHYPIGFDASRSHVQCGVVRSMSSRVHVVQIRPNKPDDGDKNSDVDDGIWPDCVDFDRMCVKEEEEDEDSSDADRTDAQGAETDADEADEFISYDAHMQQNHMQPARLPTVVVVLLCGLDADDEMVAAAVRVCREREFDMFAPCLFIDRDGNAFFFHWTSVRTLRVYDAHVVTPDQVRCALDLAAAQRLVPTILNVSGRPCRVRDAACAVTAMFHACAAGVEYIGPDVEWALPSEPSLSSAPSLLSSSSSASPSSSSSSASSSSSSSACPLSDEL